jgi:hypothetical protein
MNSEIREIDEGREDEESTREPEYSFDLSQIDKTSRITEIRQEGNYLVGLTENGIRFRQHIPSGKMLVKKSGGFVLENIEVREAAHS